MKRSTAALLAAVLLLALTPCGAFAASKADAEKVYSYKTDTLRETDRTYEEAGFTARVTVPNVLGTVKAHIETRYGSADSDVLVLYIPKDEWDGDCAYGVLSARLRSKSLSVYPGSDLVIAWKDMYQYGFIDTEGGLYTFDKDTLEMHFTAGPGLYTGVAAIPVAAGDPLGKTYEEALAAANEAGIELDYLALGYNFILALDDDMIAYYLEHGTLDRVSTYAWPGLDDLLEETRYEVQPVIITPGVHNFSIK
ncbi:MAG: hypothetical protein K5981_04850, partial [Clostridia bacterium]|nr:hypothetical protein [Clostridia bacterium]